MSRVMQSLIVLCAVVGLTAVPALAADSKPTLPKGSEFSDGPNGGGAELGTKERIPNGGESELNNGPVGIGGTELRGSGQGGGGDDRAVSPLPGWGDLPGERSPEGP
jgi:hypothetical protein